ncbi:phosphatase [Acetobacterium tundrae]|uniref:Phosphatase n=1 Tax=Acetobacterium tundrae TaxID=132932 RepID=A0ABR6WLN1_9FIRM|nr:phosphatase [Acetobacterium tundrae]MBC3797166.1 phosphatase [Acetobacterium tundrae]
MKTKINECLEKNLNLDELAAEAKREYHKKWRAENKEKVKKNNANYWKRLAIKKLKEGE